MKLKFALLIFTVGDFRGELAALRPGPRCFFVATARMTERRSEAVDGSFGVRAKPATCFRRRVQNIPLALR